MRQALAALAIALLATACAGPAGDLPTEEQASTPYDVVRSLSDDQAVVRLRATGDCLLASKTGGGYASYRWVYAWLPQESCKKLEER